MNKFKFARWVAIATLLVFALAPLFAISAQASGGQSGPDDIITFCNVTPDGVSTTYTMTIGQAQEDGWIINQLNEWILTNPDAYWGPCAEPTQEPTLPPTEEPTLPPTEEPTIPPTEEPTIPPTEEPTIPPTEEPTTPPTEEPTIEPSPSATTPPEDHVTICHALGNGGFQQISPDAEGVYKGHLGHQGGRDIIPPFTYDGTVYSQNWDETGQAIWNNGCEVPTATATVEPTETVTVEPTEVPSETATVEPTTTVPVETPTVEPTETATIVPTETATVVPTTPAETPTSTATTVPVEPTATPTIGEPPTIPPTTETPSHEWPPRIQDVPTATPPMATGANQLPVTGTGHESPQGVNWPVILVLLFVSALAMTGSVYFLRRGRAI